MTANYHTHTARCNHAAGEDREYVEQAINSGIKILGFSDHCPWVFPGGYVSPTRMQPSQLDGYFTSLTALRDEYRSDISIYIGFESEYTPELIEAQTRLLADYPVDYMILGEHFTQPEPYGAYTGYPTDSEEELRRYTDLIIEGMETGLYRYIAHPDLICFTGPQELRDRELRRLCAYMKENSLPVEINMLGLCDGRHYTSVHFLKIAAEYGLSAIIGCDAHTPGSLSDTASIELCRTLAESAGLPLIETLPGLDGGIAP
jgi:histidinol-phosphatase (PHP family)